MAIQMSADMIRRRRCRKQARLVTSAVCFWACVLASALSSVLANSESSQGKRHSVNISSGMNNATDTQVNGDSSEEYVTKAKTNENGERLSPIYATVAASPSIVEAPPPSAAPIIPKTTRNYDSCRGGGCDICPLGVVIDDSLSVTIEDPIDGNSTKATCAEWFDAICNNDAAICSEYQARLIDCCTVEPTSAPTDFTPISTLDSTLQPVESTLESPSAPFSPVAPLAGTPKQSGESLVKSPSAPFTPMGPSVDTFASSTVAPVDSAPKQSGKSPVESPSVPLSPVAPSAESLTPSTVAPGDSTPTQPGESAMKSPSAPFSPVAQSAESLSPSTVAPVESTATQPGESAMKSHSAPFSPVAQSPESLSPSTIAPVDATATQPGESAMKSPSAPFSPVAPSAESAPKLSGESLESPSAAFSPVAPSIDTLGSSTLAPVDSAPKQSGESPVESPSVPFSPVAPSVNTLASSTVAPVDSAQKQSGESPVKSPSVSLSPVEPSAESLTPSTVAPIDSTPTQPGESVMKSPSAPFSSVAQSAESLSPSTRTVAPVESTATQPGESAMKSHSAPFSPVAQSPESLSPSTIAPVDATATQPGESAMKSPSAPFSPVAPSAESAPKLSGESLESPSAAFSPVAPSIDTLGSSTLAPVDSAPKQSGESPVESPSVPFSPVAPSVNTLASSTVAPVDSAPKQSGKSPVESPSVPLSPVEPSAESLTPSTVAPIDSTPTQPGESAMKSPSAPFSSVAQSAESLSPSTRTVAPVESTATQPGESAMKSHSAPFSPVAQSPESLSPSTIAPVDATATQPGESAMKSPSAPFSPVAPSEESLSPSTHTVAPFDSTPTPVGSTPQPDTAEPSTIPPAVPRLTTNGCLDDPGCDICPFGPIVDDNKVVTVTIPGFREPETATCGEWFAAGCVLVTEERCEAYQSVLFKCCGVPSETIPTSEPTIVGSPPTPAGEATCVTQTSELLADPTLQSEYINILTAIEADLTNNPLSFCNLFALSCDINFSDYSESVNTLCETAGGQVVTESVMYECSGDLESSPPEGLQISLTNWPICAGISCDPLELPQEIIQEANALLNTLIDEIEAGFDGDVTCFEAGETRPPQAPPMQSPSTPVAPHAPFTSFAPVFISPTAAPAITVSPTKTASPTASCYTSLNDLNEAERNAEDLNVVRNYVLCADTIFFTESVDPTDVLVLRKNMHVYCGEIGGSSENNCVITAGTGAIAVPGLYFDLDAPVPNENVLVQGVTFKNCVDYALLITGEGDFQFIDCVFSDHSTSLVPVLIDSVVESAVRLKVDFNDCVFKNCISAPRSRLGLVNIGGPQSDVTFLRALFQSNDYNIPGSNDVLDYGVIIEKVGTGVLVIDSCCFVNNRAIGNALVNVYAEDLSETFSLSNFGADNSVEYLSTTGLECEFLALVEPNNQLFPTTACIEFDADECAITSGVTPTAAPTDVDGPTSTPTPVTAPIMSSEDMPTMRSVDMPTIMSGSADMPTVETHMPSLQPAGRFPVQGPTPLPVESPTLVYSPALTPSLITPSMFTPSIFTPPIVVSPVQVSSPSGSSATVNEPIGRSCGDSDACDVCGGGDVVDEDKLVTIEMPGTGRSETSTCEEWLVFVCGVEERDAICRDYQTLLIDCCTESFPLSDRSSETSVSIEPFIVKFIGVFELTDDNTMHIINAINELISPYLEMEIGEVLKYIGIEMSFMDEESAIISTADGGRKLQSSSTALIEVRGSLDLEGTSEEVNVWTKQKVTATIKNFFSVEHLRDKLLGTLVGKGLDLEDIVLHEGNVESIVFEEESSTQSVNDSNGDTDGNGRNNNPTGLIFAAICGGVVCLVVAVALFVNVKRRRRRTRFGSARGSLSTSDTATLNLRSGNDDLPDCSASNASSHDVSFPDLLGNARGKVKNGNVASERWYSEPGVSKSKISSGRLLGKHDNDELNHIENHASLYQAAKRSKKKKRRHRQPDEEVERAKAWAKEIRNKKSSSAPRPRENNEYTIDFY